MKNNTFKPNIAIAQINPIPGDINYNKNKILDYIKKAQEKNIELVIFPQMSLYGHHKEDMLEKFTFIFEQIKNALDEIREKTTITALVGYPIKEENEIYDSFALICNNEIIENVKVFDFLNTSFEIISKEEVENDNLNFEGECLICPISSISRTNKEYFRNKMFQKLVQNNKKKCLFVNQVGANDELVFDGTSRMYNENGEIIALAKNFEEDLLLIDLNYKNEIKKPYWFDKSTNLNEFNIDYDSDLERTYKALILSIKDYFSKNGFKQAVLGLSGGLDSTICAVLLADALGEKNVLGISMPSKLTSDESKNDAKELA